MEVHGKAYLKKKEMAKTQNGKCFYCSLRLGEDLTWEHLVPQSHGGCDRHRNLRVAHMKCNVLVANLPVQAKLFLADLGNEHGSDAFFLAAERVMPHAKGVFAILGSWKRARRMKPKDFMKLSPTVKRAFREAEVIANTFSEKQNILKDAALDNKIISILTNDEIDPEIILKAA